MTNVFISYRRADTAGHAGRLYDVLAEAFGTEHVFMDVDTIPPGVDFVDHIDRAVAGCDAALILVGLRWLDPNTEEVGSRLEDRFDFVRLEIESALKRPEVKVIPVLLDGAPMPGPDQLPEEIQAFARRNAIELSQQRWRFDVGRLVDALRGEAEAKPGGAVEEVVPGYRVETLIARELNSTIYRAVSADDITVILEIVAPELALDPGFVTRFLTKTGGLEALEHPNLIPIHAFGDENGKLYVVTSRVDGPSLRTLVAENGRLAPERAAAIIAQAASGAGALHAEGLIHGQLKPRSILLTGDPGFEHVYLVGTWWGSTLPDTGLTQSGSAGTIDYVTPEWIRGEPQDARSDVYALGCVLVEAIAGSPPFADEGGMKRLWAHLQAPVPSLSKLAPDAPPELDAVIARALAKDPGDRYADGTEFARALRDHGLRPP